MLGLGTCKSTNICILIVMIVFLFQYKTLGGVISPNSSSQILKSKFERSDKLQISNVTKDLIDSPVKQSQDTMEIIKPLPTLTNHSEELHQNHDEETSFNKTLHGHTRKGKCLYTLFGYRPYGYYPSYYDNAYPHYNNYYRSDSDKTKQGYK